MDLNKMFDNISIAESRLTDCKLTYGHGPNVDYYEFVVNDLKSKLTEDQLRDYIKSTTAVQDAEQEEADRQAMVKAMNENKDKPSH